MRITKPTAGPIAGMTGAIESLMHCRTALVVVGFGGNWTACMLVGERDEVSGSCLLKSAAIDGIAVWDKVPKGLSPFGCNKWR